MADVTDAQLLTAARSCLLKRLNGDAYEAYSTSEMEFKGMPIDKLRGLIRDLEQSIATDDGGTFRLVEGW